MTDPMSSDDPWMTIAEFAAELRVRPVTVRSWITKGQVRATRSGQRKWLIRRSELSRMLKGDGATAIPPPPPAAPASPAPWSDLDGVPPEVDEEQARYEEGLRRESLDQEFSFARYEWGVALERSAMAPPDARFPSRIRQIARAASAYAATLHDCIAEGGLVWKPIRNSVGMTLSYELRPGGNRPGPPDGWARFDRLVLRVGDAMAGDSPTSAADALYELAQAMTELADEIQTRPTWRSSPDDSGSSRDSPGRSESVSRRPPERETP